MRCQLLLEKKQALGLQKIEEILKDLRELRNEMVQANWPAQRLSNIILKYEDKLKGLDDMDPISEDDD